MARRPLPLPAWLGARQPRLLPPLLLALLHLVLVQGPGNLLGRILFVAHLGLFMLWQPFVSGERRLSGAGVAAILGFVAVALGWLDWWMLALWSMLLAAIVGGRSFPPGAHWLRRANLLALGYLAAALAIQILPNVARVPVALEAWFAEAFKFGLPAVLAAMILLPDDPERTGHAEPLDFINMVLVFLTLTFLTLGSLAAMLLFGRGYVESLLYTLFALGGGMLFLAWIWNPHGGFAGLGLAFSRYLASAGLPFEHWLHTLADIAERESDPEALLSAACSEMVRSLPWVAGCWWEADGRREKFGRAGRQCHEYRHPNVTLGICADQSLSPSLVWHFRLVTQLLAEFHADKRRARELQQMSYLQAVHETGARLTHDVKNLLQSLNTLCVAAQAEADRPSPELSGLLRRQLPAIAQRLAQTLDKLRLPQPVAGDLVAADAWWAGLRQRYADASIDFRTGDACGALRLPAGLFSTVAENLLQNAIAKRQNEPGLEITATLDCGPEGPRLEVRDGGAAIPVALAAALLQGPVPSENGLGIGLYQAARLAEISGYRLRLACNAPGAVCFVLARMAGASDS